jgi:hypothetical protein
VTKAAAGDRRPAIARTIEPDSTRQKFDFF